MVVDPALLLSFLAVSSVFSALPGPSVLLESSRAITHGRGSAMWIVAGNACGGLLLLGLVLSGLGAVVAASAQMFFAIKIAGACYLLWLGVQALRSAIAGHGSEEEVFDVPPLGRASLVRRGFLVGVSNPKSVVALMALLPQFVDPALGHVTAQMALIGLAGAVAQVVIETVWVMAAAFMRAWFLRRPGRVRVMEGTGGVAMIGLAGKLAVQR